MASSPESYAVEREFAESMEDPFEAILKLRARVAELEDERSDAELRDHLVQVSEAWAATETRARKAEADTKIVDLICKIMGNGTMVVETPNESYLVKMLELRGTPITLDPRHKGRDVEADWAREQAYQATQREMAEKPTCDRDERCELDPRHKGPCGRYPSGPGYWAPF